ncbi:MAG: hypothetical protein MUO62_07845 [Anaerolineales bacterium]|nr:hypothetical protein [Anaerolineales bacterium]
MVIGLLIVIWSLALAKRKYGGLVLLLLSVGLPLFGGGLFPPLIGILSGLAGIKITKPMAGKPSGRILLFAAKLWTWTLVVFLVWIFPRFPLGHFFKRLHAEGHVFRHGLDFCNPAAVGIQRIWTG